MYTGWEVGAKSLTGTGGRSRTYKHTCPLIDVKALADGAFQATKSKGHFTAADLEASVAGKKLPSGSYYTRDRHGYKTTMTLAYMVHARKAERLNGREGRYIRYRFREPPEKVRSWLNAMGQN